MIVQYIKLARIFRTKLSCCLIFLVLSHLALATNYTVNTNADDIGYTGDSGSLRYVLGVINGSITGTGATPPTAGNSASNNIITIDPSLGTILLTANLPVIALNGVTINGPTGVQVIDGQQRNIFSTFRASLSLSNLNLFNGLSKGGNGTAASTGGAGGGGGLGAGGGVYVDANQSLTLSNTVITICTAQGGAGGDGAAIGPSNVVGSGGGGASWSRTTPHGTSASGLAGGGDFYGQLVTGGDVSGVITTTGYGGGDGGTIGGGTGGAGGGSDEGINATSNVAGAGGYCGGGGGGGGAPGINGGGGGGNGTISGGGNGNTNGGGGGGYGSGGGGSSVDDVQLGGGGGGGGFGGGGGSGAIKLSGGVIISGGAGGGGGFGGGGGGSGLGTNTAGVAGSFGGAGGGGNNLGGGGGGGGAGIGGGIFVGDGATLIFSDLFGSSPVSNLENNSAVGGTAGTFGTIPAPSNGSGAGQDLFLYRGASVLFNGSSDLTANFNINADTSADNSNIDAGVTVSASGATISLFGANTYRGITTVTSGSILKINSDASLGTAPSSPVANQLTFDGGVLELFTAVELELNSNRGITLDSGGGTFKGPSVGHQGGGLVYNGAIVGVGSLTKATPTPVTLNLTNGSYSGGTIISGGTLTTNSLGDNGPLTFNGGALRLTASLSHNGIVNLNSLPIGQTIFTSANTLVLNGQVTGANLLFFSGSLVLNSTANNYSGGTSVSTNSSLQFSSDANLGHPSGNLTLASNATLYTTADVTTARTIILNTSGPSIFSPASGTVLTLNGPMTTGNKGFTMNGAGTLVLGSTGSSYSGTTTLNSGILQVSINSNFGGSTSIVMAGGSLRTTATMTTARAITLNAAGIIRPDVGTVFTVNSLISGSNSFTMDGAGTLILGSGSNSYTGGTIISNGVLQISADTNLGGAAGGVTLAGGILRTTANITTTRPISLTVAGVIQPNISTTLTLNGAISDSGTGKSLTMSGAGILVLGSTNNYTGGTNVLSGTLQAGGANLPSAGVVTVSAGGTLNLTGGTTDSSISVADLGNFNISGAATNAGSINNSGTMTLTAALTGSGTITNNASANINIDNSGVLTTPSSFINNGTVSTAIGGIFNVTNPTSGAVVNAGTTNVTAGFTPNSSSSNTGTIAISGASGNFTVPSGFNNTSGTISTASSGTLTVSAPITAGTLTNNANTIVTAALSPTNASNSSTGVMTINSGGNFTAPGAYNNTGTTNLNGSGNISGAFLGGAGSVLNIGNSSAASYTTSGTITDLDTINVLTSGTTFTANHAVSGVDTLFTTAAGTTTNINATYSGTGAVNNSGSMVIDNIFTSGVITNFSGGVIELATSGVASALINNNAGATLNITGAGSGAINNIGTLNIYEPLDATGDIDNSGFINMSNVINMPGFTLTNTGTITVHGEQTLDATSFASSGIQNYTITNDTVADKLTANCPVNLSNGTVNVSSSFIGPGSSAFTWDILIGTSITTNGGTVINPPANIGFGSWSSSLSGTTLTILYNRATMFIPNSEVNAEIATVLQEMASNITNSGQQQLLTAFGTITTQEQYNYFLDNLQPNTTTSSVTRAMQNIGFNKIEVRVARHKPRLHKNKKNRKKSKRKNKAAKSKKQSNKKVAKSGIASGDLTHNTAMWISGFGSLSKQRTDGENQGYRAKILGGMLGFDFSAKNDDVYGVALGVSNANVYASVNTTNTARVLGYNLMVYGANNLPRNYFTEWIVSGVVNKNEEARVFAINGIDLSTSASYRGALAGIRVNWGKSFAAGKTLKLSPVATAQYVLLHQPSYDEVNSVAALHVSTKDNESILTLGAGLRLGMLNNDVWLYGARELSAMITYDLLTPQQVTTANFIVGSNAFTMTSSPARLALKLGIDYGFMVRDNLDLQFSYNYEVRSGYYDNYGEIKLRYLF